MNTVFIHGLESSSRGRKGSCFRRCFPAMMVMDYRGTLEERMAQLEGQLAGGDDRVLVGSSFGGLISFGGDVSRLGFRPTVRWYHHL